MHPCTLVLASPAPRSLLAHFPVGVRHYVCQCLGRSAVEELIVVLLSPYPVYSPPDPTHTHMDPCPRSQRLWLFPTRHWLEVLLRVGANTANNVLTSSCQGYSSTDTSSDLGREHVPSLTAALVMLDSTCKGETTTSGVWEEESSDDDVAWGWDEDEDDTQDVGHIGVNGDAAGADVTGGTDAGGAIDDSLDEVQLGGGAGDVQD